ncbi:IS66-like element accessory protein TnpA [Tardibacter chloracetimidivorans]|nr:transposase [Tardibacter chloracetimidivorans]
MTVYSGAERRRRWSGDERLQVLTEAFSPGANVTAVARRYDLSTGLIYTWRRKLRDAAAPAALPTTGFAQAVVVDDAGRPAPSTAPAIVVELAAGRRVSLFASASPALAAAVLKALR